MPSYDFRCPECDERFEVTRAAGTATDVCCPVCDAPAKRIFTPVGIHFKGSGFHNTDYRKSTAGTSEAPAAPKNEAPACPSAEGGGCSGCPSAS